MRIADEFLDADGRIEPEAWADARSDDAAVGVCECGQDVFAGPTDRPWGSRGPTYYTAACAGGHDTAVPVHRVVRKPGSRILVGVSDALIEAARERDAAILGERGER